MQGNYYYRQCELIPGIKKKTGLKWQNGLINLIWDQWYVLWKIRNADIHGHDTTTQAIAERREATQQLAAIYEMREHLEPSAQELLCTDLQTHLENHPHTIRYTCACVSR
jgi:hypothetical protein